MLKKAIKGILNSIFILFGIKVKRKKYLPWGEDMYHDLEKLISKDKFLVVFDIGANVGQSSTTYLKEFPKAVIHSFEPVSATFAKLKSRFSDNTRVTPIHAALGSQSGKSKIVLQSSSTLNSLNVNRNQLTDPENSLQEEIIIETLDNYCQKNAIDIIDFIKIDTEGYEKEVLAGGLNKIKTGKIKFILLELGIKKMPQTTFYNDIHSQLSELGFEVFAFYRQSQSLYTEERFLMHSDVLFVNQNWSKQLDPEFKKKTTV